MSSDILILGPSSQAELKEAIEAKEKWINLLVNSESLFCLSRAMGLVKSHCRPRHLSWLCEDRGMRADARRDLQAHV